MLHACPSCPAGTPLWKLILKQFDDLLVKVRVVIFDARLDCSTGSSGRTH
jgi:hypothetical protein